MPDQQKLQYVLYAVLALIALFIVIQLIPSKPNDVPIVASQPTVTEPVTSPEEELQNALKVREFKDRNNHITGDVKNLYQVSCLKTPVEAVKTKSSSGVYRWQDKQGNWHFGDSRAVQNNLHKDATNLSDQYGGKLSYFKLDVRSEGKILPAFTHDRISTDTEQIFKILSQELGKDLIKQVNLNVRIVQTKMEFNRLLKAIAPNLKTSTGFYSQLNNEAVIKKQRDEDAMHQVIRHESTHVIMAGLFGYIPLWLNEGMAEYFEGMDIQLNSKKIEANEYWRYQLSETTMPLADYLAIDGEAWYEHDQHKMYAHAWSLVYFLMSHDEGKQLLKKIFTYKAKNLCENINTLKFVKKYYTGGIEGLEAAWQAWLADTPAIHYY